MIHILKDQDTPLHIASRDGKEEIVKLLLEKGVNLNAKDKVVILNLFFLLFFTDSLDQLYYL